MGCYDTDPGRRRGPAGDLGLCRNASVVGPGFMPAPDYPVHRGSFICMKWSAIRLSGRHSLARRDRGGGALLPLYCYRTLAAGFQQIADFSEQLLLGRRAGRHRRQRRLLEAVHLFNEEEKAKRDN